MKRFTLVALATLIGASSVIAFSSGVKAESREEYCRHHDCGTQNRRERDRERERERERARYQQEHQREQRRRWYDNRTHQWRYENR